MSEIDLGGLVMRVRADATGVETGLNEAVRALERTKQATDEYASAARTAMNAAAQAYKSAGIDVEMAASALVTARAREKKANEEAAKYATDVAKAAATAAKQERVACEEVLAAARRKASQLKEISESLKNQYQQAATAATDAARTEAQAANEQTSASQQAASAAQRAANEQTIAYTALAAAAVKTFKIIVNAIQTGVEASNAYTAAVQGMESVASAHGISSDRIAKALEGVTDAFFNSTAAATAFKNLLARGYTLDQATQTIVRLKDAAAFGRQASYDLAGAVVTATEGLKNENSILVDNAGVTKNVSVMWKEYAASIGVGVQSLTQAQKIEAEYQGIMQETAAQQGDLAKLSDTVAGAQAGAAMASTKAWEAFGGAMSPIIEGASELETALLQGLTGATEACPPLTAGLTTVAGAFTTLTAATTLFASARKALDVLKITSPTLLGLGAAAAVLGVIAGAYTAVQNAAAAAKKEMEDQAKAAEEAANAQKARVDRMDELVARYTELAGKQNKTLSEAQESASIQSELASSYGVTASTLELLTRKTGAYGNALDLLRDKELAALQDGYAQEAIAKRQLTYTSDISKAYGTLENATMELTEAQEAYRTGAYLENGITEENARKRIALAEQEVIRAREVITQYEGLYAEWFTAAVKEGETSIARKGGQFSDSVRDTLLDAFKLNHSEITSQAGADEMVDGLVQQVLAACSDPSTLDAITAMQNISDRITAGLRPSETDIADISKAWGVLSDQNGPLWMVVKAFADASTETEPKAQAFAESLYSSITPMNLFGLSMTEWVAGLNNTADEAKKALAGTADTVKTGLASAVSILQSGVKDLGGTYGEQFTDAFCRLMQVDESTAQTEAENAARTLMSALTAAMSGDMWAEPIVAAQAMHQQLLSGYVPTEEEYDTIAQSYTDLRDLIVMALGEVGIEASAQSDIISDMMSSLIAPEAAAQSWQEFANLLRTDVSSAITEMTAETDTLYKRAKQTSEIQTYINAWKNAKKAYDAARKSGEGVELAFRDMTKAGKALGVSVDKGTGSLEDMDSAASEADKSVTDMEAGVKSAASDIVSSLQSTISEAEATRQALIIRGDIDVNTDPGIQSLNALISVARTALAFLNALGLGGSAGETKPRGGGGGGGKDAEQEAEEARRAAEEARKQAIQDDYDVLDHRRHINEITLEEYIDMLRAMKHEHQMTAEEIMELEERIYDAEQELRQRREEQVDRLASGLVTALENRYQKMLDAETERLDQSREAWQTWADDSTAAIQAQIDALDRLSDTEDREKKDQEELRKIAKLRQEIEFEQDAYNRAKLSQQLEQTIAAREERLRKLEINDQKTALQSQIEAIQAEAEAQQAALDKEQAALEAQYDERMRQAALEAEAQRMLTGSTQQDILALIGAYAPEYNATGQSLGEKLASGFLAGVGNIEAWFDGFNESIQSMQAQIAQAALSAADQLYAGQQRRAETAASAAPVVNQTVNIHQPVETPSETARRMREIDEELAAQILRGQ